jgi:hypothetical protein
MSMKPSPKLRLGVWDALVAACVMALAVACAAALWSPGTAVTGELTAVVSMDGEEADRIPLSKTGAPQTLSYTNNGYTLLVEAGDGEIRVSEADCPTQDCVHTGFIHRVGQSIVCLPARIVIQLEGASGGDDVDLVIG